MRVIKVLQSLIVQFPDSAGSKGPIQKYELKKSGFHTHKIYDLQIRKKGTENCLYC